jgi:ligand-binding sensor domain-containing protein/signal transduction histidine kinase
MVPRFKIPLFLAILFAWGRVVCGQSPQSIDFSLQTDGTHPFGDLTTRYRVQQWKVEQGLPQNHVTCLMQSHDGYVWVGTVFGLARYDGVRFTVFEKSSLPLMVETDDHILGLAEDRDHAIWVCARNGLLRRQEHTWTAFITGGPELGKYQPTGVCTAKEGGVWVGVHGAVMRFDQNGPKESFKLDFKPAVRSVRMLAEDDRGRVWLADRYRVMRWTPGEDQAVMVFDYSNAVGWVHYLYKDPDDGSIRFGGQFGAYKVENDLPRLIGGFKTSSGGILTNTVFAIADDGHGRVWTAEDGRLVQSIFGKSGEEPQEIGVHRHPGLTSVEKLMRDAEGNLWAGTSFDGLLFIKEHRIATLIAPGGRLQNNLWSVCEDSEGAIWMGSSRNLLRWHQNELTPFGPPPSSMPNGLVFSVVPDPRGGIWVGYAGYGLFHFDGTRWEPGPRASLSLRATNDLNTRCILTRRDGSVWFGMLDGLYSWSNEKLTHYTKTNGLPGNDIRALHEDASGNLWIGTYGDGLSRYRSGTFTNFGRQEGLQDLQISAFLEEPDGSLWIGTSSGLARHRNGSFRTLTRKEGLYDNLVNQIVADDYGSYWISCNRGIYRISKDEAREVADGTLEALTSMPFGESEGMQSAETNGGSQPAGWKSRDGLLWFPTGNGLIRIDPKDFLVNKRRPSVVVEQVIANAIIRYGDGADRNPPTVRSGEGRWQEQRARPEQPFHLQFPAGQAGVVEIRYTANSFGDPSKVRFQYRMIGHDRGWQEAGDRRIAHYTNLDPGTYEFQIRACSSHGLWGPIDRHLTFTIAPYFHQTWWFVSLSLLGIVASVMAVQSYRLKTQRTILQLEKEHALEKERARIAKDMHDDLGARLTQLGMISQAIESPGFQANPGEGSPLPKISALARDAVRSLDEIVWAVSPGKNSLDQLAGYLVQSAQDLITPSGLRFELQMPPHIPPVPLTSELRHNVFLVSKEALNNAVKHSGGHCIRLEFSHGPQEGRVVISDDGDGFDIADAAGAGNGLANMRKRAESVGASFDLDSRKQQGTRIEVRFPLPMEGSR